MKNISSLKTMPARHPARHLAARPLKTMPARHLAARPHKTMQAEVAS